EGPRAGGDRGTRRARARWPRSDRVKEADGRSSPGLRAAFWKAIVIALAVAVGLGILIHFLNAGHHRPEGTAEHWLSAVSDAGRSGVRKDALRRAADLGTPSLGRVLTTGVDTGNRHDYFSDLEVGRAVVSDRGARVPFRLHTYA